MSVTIYIYMYTCIYVYKYDVSCIYTCEHINSDLRPQRFLACARTEKATSRCHCAQATFLIISSMRWRDTLCDATAGILSCSSKCFVGVPSTKWYLHSISPPDLATLAAWISSWIKGATAHAFLEHAKPSYKSPSSSPSLRASYSSLPRLVVMERTWGNYTVDPCAKRISDLDNCLKVHNIQIICQLATLVSCFEMHPSLFRSKCLAFPCGPFVVQKLRPRGEGRKLQQLGRQKEKDEDVVKERCGN